MHLLPDFQVRRGSHELLEDLAPGRPASAPGSGEEAGVFRPAGSRCGETPEEEPAQAGSAEARGAGREHHREECKRSEEHTSELQSLRHLVCRLLLEKKNK